MNQVILSGRLTRDPDIKYANNTTVARYTLAVERRFKKDGEQSADFISCVAFGKNAEFSEKYLKQGTKIIVSGHIQTGSYTNKDGHKVYTTDVVIDSQEFAESKNASASEPKKEEPKQEQASVDDFMKIDDGITDDEMPFK